jgi:uncharacterized protein YecT (DUF1311 family)
MRQIAWTILVALVVCEPLHAQVGGSNPQVDCHTTLFGGTTCTQHTAPSPTQPLSNSCRFGTSAAARLMCAYPKLAAMDSSLAKAYRGAKQVAPPDEQKALLTEQLNWIRQRNQKCGLTGKDNASLDQLRPAAQCMEEEIKARIDALQTAFRPDTDDHATQCQSARSASGRLICADPDLADADLALSRAFHEAEKAAPPYDQKRMEQEQLTWVEARDEKCQLIGKDTASIDELRTAKPCMEHEIKVRFAALIAGGQSKLTGTASAPQSQGVVLDPILDTDASGQHPAASSRSFQALRLSAASDGLKGAVKCSAPLTYEGTDPLAHTPFSGKWGTAIVLDDDENSYRIFETENWVPALNNIRNAARSACAAALASGQLRNVANETIAKLYDLFEVIYPDGVFMAYSTGQNSSWTVAINAPQARREMKASLGIQTWVDPTQLTRNPYFYKDNVVGVIIRFDHMLPQGEAVFTWNGSDVLVTAIPPNLSRGTDLIVLSGRVRGNKGVIEPSGNEVVMPVLDYVGAANCGNMCQALQKLARTTRPDFPSAGLEK